MNCKVLTGKYEQLYRLIAVHFASFFDDLPMTSTQAWALEFVMEKAAIGEVYQKDLEAFLNIRGSSATSLINNLERDGYIRRESVKFDGRYRHLAPTEKALALQKDISQRIDRYMESLFVGISENDLKIYESVLEKIADNVR